MCSLRSSGRFIVDVSLALDALYPKPLSNVTVLHRERAYRRVALFQDLYLHKSTKMCDNPPNPLALERLRMLSFFDATQDKRCTHNQNGTKSREESGR